MSNDTRPAQRGRAGQTRRASTQARKPDSSRGIDTTTMVFIGLVLAVIAGSAYLVMQDQAVSDTGAVQEWSESVTVDGEALPRFDSQSMTPTTDPALGRQVPTATGEDLFGEEVTLPVEGEPTVMVYLSHSCPHCQAELPLLLEEWVYGDVPEGVNVAAVTTNTSSQLSNFPPSDWLLAREDPWTAPILADTRDNRVAQAHGLGAYPYFVVVGADGTVQARTTGEIGREQLGALLDIAAGSAGAQDAGDSGVDTQVTEAPTSQ